MAKQQKGWVDAQAARDQAARAHRHAAIKQARKGKANAPEYRETSAGGCPLLIVILIAWAVLIWRATMRRGWRRG